MNISAAELAALAALPTSGTSAGAAALLWTVVQLERTGDATQDPYRKAWGFASQANAQAFAATLRSTARSSCVIIFQGTTISSTTGDTSLIHLYTNRVGTEEPLYPDAGELADVTAAVALSPKSRKDIADLGDSAPKHKLRRG